MISETWLISDKKSDKLSPTLLPGYNLITADRKFSRGGGVGMYLKQELSYHTIHKMSKNLPAHFEHLLIKFKGKSYHDSIILGVLYKPPKLSVTDWIENFQILIQEIIQDSSNSFLLGGDFNIDLLSENNAHKKLFLDLLLSFNLNQSINQPTRCTTNTETLLDLFISNNTNSICQSGILPHPPIADHETIYIILKIMKPKNCPITKIIRNTKHFIAKDYLHDISQIEFHQIYEHCQPESMLITLNSLLRTVIDKHLPLKVIKVTKPPAPWMTDDLKRMIIKKHKLYNKYKKNAQLKEQFTVINKLVKGATEEAKQNFITDCLANPTTRGVWNVIKRLLTPNAPTLNHNIDNLNQHFITTSERINARPITHQPPNLQSNSGSFIFQTVTQEEVLYFFKKLKLDVSTGPDLIPIKFIKPIAHFIAPHLTNIINTCIRNNYFPELWKISRIVPVPKIDNPTELDHYRPISILPCLSKIYEKILATQLLEHLESQSLLPQTTSGSRKGHSTTTVLLHIADICRKALKSSEITILSLLDFSKAFDTVNHSKFLQLLIHFDFSNQSIFLFQSYLADRKQYIEHQTKKSTILSIKSGVPQGSILGAIIFNMYVASINFQITDKGFNTINYVDDFQIAISGSPKQLPDLKNKTSEALQSINIMTNNLDLKFNTKKSIFLIIAKKHQHKLPEIMNLNEINGINKSTQQKNLGVTFDQQLTFHQHHLTNLKACYAIFHSLKHLKYKLSPTNKKTIIHSLIFSKLTYGNLITYPLNKFWTNKYNSLFKACLSFIQGHYIHSSDLFNHGILSPQNMYISHLLNTTFKALYNPSFPNYLKLNFQASSRFSLRSDDHPLVERPRINSTTFHSAAANHFNSLPSFIRDTNKFHLFKHLVKHHLLNQQISDI
jgi:hypothetical protein